MSTTRKVDGARLRDLRVDSGLSLRALAAELGKSSPTYLSLIEQGKTAPSDLLIGRLASKLGVHPDAFSVRDSTQAAVCEERAA